MTHNTNVRWFDSPEDYANYLSGIPNHLRATYSSDFGGDSYETGIKKLQEGDTTRLEQAQKIIDQLNVGDIVSNHVPILEASIAGYMPNVPAYISGHPLSMFNK